MIRYFVFFATLVGFLAISGSAFACKCFRESKEASYKSAKTVFFAKATEDGKSLKVLKNFKGTKKKRTLKILTEDSCDMVFQAEKTYMVFANFTDKKKRTVKVSSCGASSQLDYQPLSATAWSYSDELPYGTSRNVVKRYTDQRSLLERTALKALTKAAVKCDKATWAGSEKVTAHLQVRFDLTPDGTFETALTKVEPKNEENPIDACLQEKLAAAKFKKFSGGPVSVRAYWKLDRIDKRMKQEKKRSQVIPFKQSENSSENSTQL